MRSFIPGARLRLLIALVALPTLTVVAFSAASQSTVARPPAARPNVPAEAFTPVALPGRRVAVGRMTPGDDPTPGPVWRTRLQDVIRERTPPAGPRHLIRRGESLWQIAAWHRADLRLILRWNPGIDPRRLVVGQRILVPGGSPMAVRTGTVTSGPPARTVAGPSGHLWPLRIRGTITTRFSRAHPGIDIAAPAGTPVRAIAGGTVVWAGWSSTGGGNVVEIRHPDGMRSRYLHNRAVLVAVGQIVAQGEQIATVGSTGWSTGPHLDLRITMGGRFIDPLRLAWSR